MSKPSDKTYGYSLPQTHGRAERACAVQLLKDTSPSKIQWTWESIQDRDSPLLVKELKLLEAVMHPDHWQEAVVELHSAMSQAERGELRFQEQPGGEEKNRTFSDEFPSTWPVGPVKPMRSTKAVFEISFHGRDYTQTEMDNYRHVRLYFTEPPMDSCKNGQLLALFFASKPHGSSGLQDKQVRDAQNRYDNWMRRDPRH